MITFLNKNLFRISKIKQIEKSTSTLLIPAHLVDGLKTKIKQNRNSLVVYFRYLLRTYRALSHSGMLPPPTRLKTEFQREGLNLKRFNFLVDNADWLELGELALAFGKSRCYLFTFLLELDLLGLWKILSEARLTKGVPRLSNLQLSVSWSLSRISQNFERIYYVRI
ncbi:MAG: DUF1564 family protein [Leptospiraceae bacterium]|nr:DUF1564 family protein [Leptospiraceae bacterium]